MLVFTGCFRNDQRVVTFNVPQMQAQECLNFLSGRLRGAEGVEDVRGDFTAGTVTVTFNGLKLALKNIEFIIAEAGFDVNDTPGAPDARAALPVPCR
ncbi:MAG TPA: heavy-metal-associated domain-containing protein [Kiritimatiellia bacterium]|nr:heavy-metal-associated domain-containing protein [Kiritimatiellia bacterium]HMO99251.1 heavy-metal-associated domain-containing protein [Kiritimatiellia bacterium]